MLEGTKRKALQDFLSSLTEEELIWTNGYIAGLTSSKSVAAPLSSKKLTILYGTESGNSKKLAAELNSFSRKHAIAPKVVSLDQYRLTDLSKEEYVTVIISTQGDGEPPASSKKFYDHIHNEKLNLSHIKFGILALGDTSYPMFCKAGEDVDQRFELLGATRLLAIRRCDTDFDQDSKEWFSDLIGSLQENIAPAKILLPAIRKKAGKDLYRGSVISNVNLSGRGSEKQTHHIEIATEEVDFEPGDSIGIVPKNPEKIVTDILSLLSSERTHRITYLDRQYELFELLTTKLSIVYLPERVVKKYAQLVGQDIPPMKIGLLNLLKIYPVSESTTPEELISILEPIVPRLYSIASSPVAHTGEIHLTVARNSFTVNNEKQFGLCSDYFVGLEGGSSFDFYVHRNAGFKLPSPETDIIMIGPGTGIAPFRSFIAHREVIGARGRNWLFFGEQRFASDFLYQTEIQDQLQSGTLNRVSLAFSRDQKEKRYVQHCMEEWGSELFSWLESGACLYICGSRNPMSEDVEKALSEIVVRHGGRTAEQAVEYIENLRETGRLQKDVY